MASERRTPDRVIEHTAALILPRIAPVLPLQFCSIIIGCSASLAEILCNPSSAISAVEKLAD
jgi:hypothetical protein